MISLKDMFYERSDSLVGICKDVGTNSSHTMTLDLKQYDKENPGRGTKRDRRAVSEGGPSSKRASLGLSPAPSVTTQ